MNQTIYSAQAEILTKHIRKLRKEAGITQRELAKLLEREHSMIARIELGERRLDLVECFWLFKALGCDPVQEVSVLMKRIANSVPEP